MTHSHTHLRAEELHVFWIPAIPSLPMEYKIINNSWEDLGRLVGGYIELIHPELELLPCGCSAAMIVNDQGMIYRLPPNIRATTLYPHGEVVGDVVILGEGLIKNGGSEPEMDFVSLPPEFHYWKGPGHPYPDPQEAWPVDPGNKS